MWGSMLTFKNAGAVASGILALFTGSGATFLGLSLADYIVVALGVAAVACVSSLSAKKSVRERLYDRPALAWTLCGGLFVAVLLFGAYGVGYDASQFIYNQF